MSGYTGTTSSHRHTISATSTDVANAIAAHVAKYHTAPAPATTLDTVTQGWGIWKPYIAGDPGDRLDTDWVDTLPSSQVVFNADGSVTLRCEKAANPSGRPYSGGYLDTFGTFAQKFGHFEAKLRWSAGQGYWPSWFLLPQGQRLPYPEIDIVEYYGTAAPLGSINSFTNAVHYAGEPADPALRPEMWGVATNGAPGVWHVLECDWTATQVVFRCDGVVTKTVTTNIPQAPLYPILMSGVGAGGFRADATTPALMTLDVGYVRVTL